MANLGLRINFVLSVSFYIYQIQTFIPLSLAFSMPLLYLRSVHFITQKITRTLWCVRNQPRDLWTERSILKTNIKV
jgi:hypothetical protein